MIMIFNHNIFYKIEMIVRNESNLYQNSFVNFTYNHNLLQDKFGDFNNNNSKSYIKLNL